VTLSSYYEFENAAPIEQSLRQKFGDKHARGEWYRLDQVDLSQINQICELLGGSKRTDITTISEEAVEEADVIGEIASEITSDLSRSDIEKLISEGWRLERKPQRNKSGATREYYVLRLESKKDGKRHRPSIYLGKDNLLGPMEEPSTQ